MCGKPKHSYRFVKKQIEKKNYKLLSEIYKNSKAKLEVQCSEGHQYKVTYNNFQQGKKCPYCIGKGIFDYEYIKKQFEEKGYKLLSNEYKNNHTKLNIECPKGHQYEVRYNDFQQGCRCPICYDMSIYSRSEKDCLDIIKQLIPNENIIENDRSQIINPETNKHLELDIWIPSLNKAIEFNGEYWHSSDDRKYKDYQKNIQCKEKNIDLITIWYQDWIINREQQIEKIKTFLGETKC